MRCIGCGAELTPGVAHTCGAGGYLPGAVYVYACPMPPEPSIPDVHITWPPKAEPSTTDQEIGALKHRVGLLEQQMRELAEKFIARQKPAKKGP